MADEKDDDEPLHFWHGWRGLYVFLLIYGVLQVLLLYIFTRVFNRP